MSAFLCDFATFDALAQFGRQWEASVYLPNYPMLLIKAQQQFPEAVRGGVRLELKSMTCQDIGQILWAENWRSLNARYPDTRTNRADAPGVIREVTEDYTYRPVKTDLLSAVAIIKACHCLDYQSCETDDWEETLACAMLRAIERAAVRHLPGYDAAQWGLTEDDVRGRGRPPLKAVR